MIRRGAFLILLLAGCDSWDPRNQALHVASEALSCNTLELTQTRENVYEAVGCGQQGTFACTSGHLEPHCIQVRTSGSEIAQDDESDAPPHDTRSIAESEAALYADHDDDVDPSADESAAETHATSDATDPPSPAEAAIRAGLDAHRADIYACTQQDPTVLRVNYETDGSLVVHLSGGLAGSPEEGCVRAALSGARAPEGSSGVVLHLVHR